MGHLWDKKSTDDNNIHKYIQHNNQIIIQYTIKPLKEDEEFVRRCVLLVKRDGVGNSVST